MRVASQTRKGDGAMTLRRLLRGREEPRGEPLASAPVRAPEGGGDPARRNELVDALEASGRLFLWSTDGAGRLLYLSPGAAGRLGARDETLVGRNFAQVFATDPECASGRADRPLQFLATARQRMGLPCRASP